MKTKTLTQKDIPELEEGQEVVIKKLNYGERSELSDKTTEIEAKEVGNKVVPMVKVSSGKSRIYTLLYSIVKCPWYNDSMPENQKLQAIKELDTEIGEAILEATKSFEKPKEGDVEKKSDKQPAD